MVKKQYLLTFLPLLIIMSIAVFATTNGYFQNRGSGYELSGTIYCSDGNALKGMKVYLYSDAGLYPESPSAVSKTRNDGAFKFNSSISGSQILEIHGDLGTGRIYVPYPNTAGNIDITYPVKEEIVFLHTNDQHFDMNNLREFSLKLKEIRDKYENVFLLSAGDIFVRHPHRWTVNGELMTDVEWYGERASYMINTMNDLGYDLLTLGNHELAYIKHYTRMALELAEFPLLAANINLSTEKMPSLDAYSFLETNTWRKIAVLGLTNDNAKKDGIEVLDFEETVQKYMPLKDSADIFLALTHIGFRRDNELTEKFPGFDLIIGGHSHTLLNESILVNGVLISQAGGSPHFVSDDHPVFLGKTIITLENGKIKEKSGRTIKIEAHNKDNPANGIEVSSGTKSEVEAEAETVY